MRVQKLKTGSEQIIYQVWRCTTISNLMINEQIRDKEVRLIGPDGEQLGIMSAREAMAKAQEAAVSYTHLTETYDLFHRIPGSGICFNQGMGRQEQISMIRERKKETKTDTVLLILVLLLAVFGLVMLFSISEYNGRVRFGDSAYYFKKQLFATALGLMTM